MWAIPMNRWYVSRWFNSASVEDFGLAISSLSETLEKITGDKYDLKIAFYKAAAAVDADGEPVKPQTLKKEITALEDMSAREYRKADYVEATLTVRPNAVLRSEGPHFHTAKISAKWPDARRIDFEVHPPEHAREICHAILDGSRFTFWTRGLKTF